MVITDSFKNGGKVAKTPGQALLVEGVTHLRAKNQKLKRKIFGFKQKKKTKKEGNQNVSVSN